MEIQYDVEINDNEMKGFDKHMVELLTFDLVQPIAIIGAAEIYSVDLEIKMSNGEVIIYNYNEGRPYSAGNQKHYCTIDGKQIKMSDFDDHPGVFIRSQYLKYLQDKIKVKGDTNELSRI